MSRRIDATTARFVLAWVIALLVSSAAYLATPLFPVLRELNASDWASWVQAVGSLLAVFAAIGLVAWQQQHERRSSAREEIRKVQLLWSLAYHCRAIAECLDWTPQHPEDRFTIPGGISTDVAALRNVRTLEMPDEQVVVAVLTIVEAFDDFNDGIAGRLPAATVGARINALLENLTFAERQLRIALERRNAELPPIRWRINGRAVAPLEVHEI